MEQFCPNSLRQFCPNSVRPPMNVRYIYSFQICYTLYISPIPSQRPPTRCNDESYSAAIIIEQVYILIVFSRDNNRTSVGAYRIRPDVSENGMISANMIPSLNVQHPRHEGRMRYAPTPVR